MTNLTEALASAKLFRQTFNDGDLIDEESGFMADHLTLLIEWANTCSDVTVPNDGMTGRSDAP